MEETDYTIGLPTEPPEDMISFLRKQGAFGGEYLVYKSGYTYNPLTDRRERAIEVICTECGQTFYQEHISAKNECSWRDGADIGFISSESQEKIFSGDCTFCPSCGAEVKAVHTSRISRYGSELDKLFPITVDVINGRLTILTWLVKRQLDKNARTYITSEPYEAYILDGKKMIKLCGYHSSMFNRTYTGRWEMRKRCTDTFGKHISSLTYPFDPKILIGTDAENCKLDIYLKSAEYTYPITYLRIWQKHKNAENLVMQGAADILTRKIESNNIGTGIYSSNITGIDWKKNRPHEMLGLTKSEFKRAVKEKWKPNEIEFYLEAKRFGVGLDDMPKCIAIGFYNTKKLFGVDNNVLKSLEYLKKQEKKYPKNKSEIDTGLLADYWKMAEKVGEDISDNKIKYPQNLVRAHNTVLMRMKFKEKAELREKFAHRYEELSELCYSYNGLTIRPAMNENELINEGKILNHCVASYANTHANGKTAIFFIRHSADDEMPYFTLELDEKNLIVRQNRGKYNCSRTDEVREFEEKWLEHIKKLKGEIISNGRTNDSAERKTA